MTNHRRMRLYCHNLTKGQVEPFSYFQSNLTKRDQLPLIFIVEVHAKGLKTTAEV